MSNNQNFVGTLQNGARVYDREDSHWKTGHKNLSHELLKEALSRITLSPDDENNRDIITKEIDMGRVVGKNSCITVNPTDNTFMAKRIGRRCLSHVVINKEFEDSTKVIVLLGKNGNDYTLITAYIGCLAPMEPGDPRLLETNDTELIEESKKFWSSHALVYNKDVLEYVIAPNGQKLEVAEFEKEYIKQDLSNNFDIPEDGIIMLMGIAASGKSSITKQLSDKYNAEIISSDSLRDEMFKLELENRELDKVYSAESKEKVYDEMISKISENMQKGKSSIADATFLFEAGEKARRRIYELATKYQIPLRVIILKTPVDLAKELNQKRARHVSDDVIEKMWEQMNSTYDYIIEELEELPNTKYKVIETKALVDKEIKNDETIK